MTQLEGSGASRLLQLFTNKDTPITLSLATVKSLPPELSVLVDGDSEVTPYEGIIIAEHLTDHTREISGAEVTIKSNLKLDSRVICAIANDGQMVYVLDKAVI